MIGNSPDGHFFENTQTMERYNTEFYEPLVHDNANFGTWTERGAQYASTRRKLVQNPFIDGKGFCP